MNESILIFLNMIVCGTGGFIVVCRLKFLNSNTKPHVRYHYIMWFPLFAWSALSYTYGDVPGLSQLALSCGAVAQLILGSKPWKYGPPKYTMKNENFSAGD